jgi:hypothetical protein
MTALSRPPVTDEDRARLRFSFQAPSLRQAVNLAAELRTLTADVVQVHPSPDMPSGPRAWIVTVTTPPMGLRLEVVLPWEQELLAVEHRWPGCCFLGWMTCSTPTVSIGPTVPIGPTEAEPKRSAEGARQRQSQRELVAASLLRCPPPEQRGIVHGRGVPR